MQQRRAMPAGGRLVLAGMVAVLGALAACGGDGATGPDDGRLSGLSRVEQGDSIPTEPANAPATPGAFHGNVYGYVPGGDTLATRVPLAGVRVTAYESARATDGSVAPGDQVAATVTDAAGAWALPTLPGGEYVVAFVPPAGSGYRGAWAIATAWAHSNDHGWFLMLPKTAGS